MQADPAPPATIDEYIAGFPPDVQKVLRQERAEAREKKGVSHPASGVATLLMGNPKHHLSF